MAVWEEAFRKLGEEQEKDSVEFDEHFRIETEEKVRE